MTLGIDCYNKMFENCTNLTSAPELPANTLAIGCYEYMFSGTSLTSAPKLPATELEPYCYHDMFLGCDLLLNAPEMSAKTISEYCCAHMFRDCTSLTSAPKLPTTTALAESCYANMFDNCSSLMIYDTPIEGGIKFLDIPNDATSKQFWNRLTFVGTGGPYTDDPQIGHTYYYIPPQEPEQQTPKGFNSIKTLPDTTNSTDQKPLGPGNSDGLD